MISEDFEMVKEELLKAMEKHPSFCDKFTKMNIFHARHEEKMYKAKNETSPHFADDILLEEVSEARTAYIQGNRQHCLEELAQCGAVVLRMMELVRNEML